MKFRAFVYITAISVALIYALYMIGDISNLTVFAQGQTEQQNVNEHDDHSGHGHDDHEDEEHAGENENAGDGHVEHRDQDDHTGHDHDDHEEKEHAGEDENASDGPVEHSDEDDHTGHDHDDHEEEEHTGEGENAGDGHDEHSDEDDHTGHGHDDHSDEEEGLRLTEKQRARFDIEIKQAGPGSLSNEVSLRGEIVANEDRLVHLSPRVSGIVRNVTKTLGDHVKSGEVIAVLESRELADYKAEFIASRARETLAEQNHKREEQLLKKNISSEQEYLNAKTALAEARIERESAEQKLHALGLSEKYLETFSVQHNVDITRYEITAPIDGTIIAKHISLGENIEQSSKIFTVADLSSVWVNLTVHAKDLLSIRSGQSVLIQSEFNGDPVTSNIEMITPFVDEATRTALARVVIDNSDGHWFPGTFVNGYISESTEQSSLIIPKNAVLTIDEKNIVFVEEQGVFEMKQVEIGRTDRTHVEILSGLTLGTNYVAEGAFQLKSTVVTSNLGSHAGHGH